MGLIKLYFVQLAISKPYNVDIKIRPNAHEKALVLLLLLLLLYTPNAPLPITRVKFDWEHEGILLDRDGSLTGSVGSSVAPCSLTFNPALCVEVGAYSVGAAPGCVCDSQVGALYLVFFKIKY